MKQQTESERFKEFVRKLVNVPKSEIDKKAEEYHKHHGLQKGVRPEFVDI